MGSDPGGLKPFGSYENGKQIWAVFHQVPYMVLKLEKNITTIFTFKIEADIK